MKMWLIKLLITFLYFSNEIYANYDSNPIVTTSLGAIRGRYKYTFSGRKYAAFEGIPYAKSPIHKYRFREPRPMGSWKSTIEARFLRTCLQFNHYSMSVIGEEDCLHLNVYSPIVPISYNQQKLPVIVFIHGGAFMFGSGHSYNEMFLMDQNVLYVTMNYRLGPLGFLSTEDAALPGNLGLKDQALAIEWINNHIAAFGGDPSKITLTGLSAGGASVHLHYLSPKSSNSFARGMSFSGTALAPWVLQENAREKSFYLASLLDCPITTTTEMIHCLSHIPARSIVELVPQFFAFLYNPFSPFGPVVEPPGSKNPIISTHPYLALQNGQFKNIPWLTALTDAEGLYPGAELWPEEQLQRLDSNWLQLAPHLLDFNYTLPVTEQHLISQQIRQHYLGSSPISRNTFTQLINLISDRLFVASTQLSAKIQASKGIAPVHAYYFKYRGAHSASERLSNVNVNFGAAHCDDVVYVLNSNVQVNATDADRIMMQTLMDLWISFSNNGIPMVLNASWPSVSRNIRDPFNYLEINGPQKVTPQQKDFDNVKFWMNLPFQENQNLFAWRKDEL